jgi:hypothetical protein
LAEVIREFGFEEKAKREIEKEEAAERGVDKGRSSFLKQIGEQGYFPKPKS